jgi:hypothetical protein
MWFNFLSKILPNRDLATTLKKILMGQAVFGPVINTVFFSYNGALQGSFHILNAVFSSLFDQQVYIIAYSQNLQLT